jgi:hypothetical protein
VFDLLDENDKVVATISDREMTNIWNAVKEGVMKTNNNGETFLNRKDFLEKNKRQLADKLKQATGKSTRLWRPARSAGLARQAIRHRLGQDHQGD